MSLDETSFGRHGACVHGFAPRGKPIYAAARDVPTLVTRSVLACVSADGLVATTEVVRGSFNSASFSLFLQALPVPAGTVVLLDNVAFHHTRKVQEVARAKGLELLYVPPYSPWFNPIERCFSVVKRHWYTHRDVPAAFAALSSLKCANIFAHTLGLYGPDGLGCTENS